VSYGFVALGEVGGEFRGRVGAGGETPHGEGGSGEVDMSETRKMREGRTELCAEIGEEYGRHEGGVKRETCHTEYVENWGR
jgi:hypothetical protein